MELGASFPMMLAESPALGDDSDLKQRRSPFFLLRMRKPFSICFSISLNKNWFQANYPSANIFYEHCRWFSHGVWVDNHWSETWVGAEKKLREGLLSPCQSFIAEHGEEPQSVILGEIAFGELWRFSFGFRLWLKILFKILIEGEYTRR